VIQLVKSVSKKKVVIRAIRREDVKSTAELLARLKRLNGEFDPLLKTIAAVETAATKSIDQAMSSDKSVVLVAIEHGKVVGFVKADVTDRIFYEPRKEGAIVEFYILPEFRRGSLGKELLSAVSENLKIKGADLITAEFPSQNEIARRFYTKLGFRSLTNVYAKSD
jgi:ribosomal protein S18 acetylase RimI-like enzyme